ncbi:hypothetical protein PV04_05506 [Phialophora macrospora]|uniref:SMODS and SLOG-associating 2TM effector domain-containing protein n=1 Tax=Phialophora macrospora TaxID=1851006 RepID=A0A0D2CWT9_9EURO|nr:hypothetical protein PV04_05506 [Phialophora macrospora]
MSPGIDEQTPLLWQPNPAQNHNRNVSLPRHDSFTADAHAQFCMMVGVPSSEPTPEGSTPGGWRWWPSSSSASSSVPAKSLYGRATRQLAKQRWTYYGTASLSNTLLLSQVVLGAALTALGASESSHILITVFGALNTVIAGLVAYLKSRGQPMRARMYRDDLERVVDEIENSEVMWLGISRGVHGYEDIDTGGGKDGGERRAANVVSVRSEVARLTRLYDRAVRNNTVNNPDMYMTGAAVDGGNYGGGGGGAALRSHIGGSAAGPVGAPAPVGMVTPVVPQPVAPALVPAAPAPVLVLQEVHDPDESPATAPPKPKEEKKKKPEETAKPEAKKEEETDAKAKGKGKDEEEETLSKAPTVADKPQGDAPPAVPAATTPIPPSTPVPAPANQIPYHDPDAEPASDVNVPLKKVPGDAADGEN